MANEIINQFLLLLQCFQKCVCCRGDKLCHSGKLFIPILSFVHVQFCFKINRELFLLNLFSLQIDACWCFCSRRPFVKLVKAVSTKWYGMNNFRKRFTERTFLLNNLGIVQADLEENFTPFRILHKQEFYIEYISLNIIKKRTTKRTFLWHFF